MMIDSDKAIKRMQNVIEHYKKYGYMEEVMYRMAGGHCILPSGMSFQSYRWLINKARKKVERDEDGRE